MPYQSRVVEVPTPFHLEDNGVWTLVDCDGDGTPDLCYIKTKNTDSNMIEVHYTTGQSNFQAPYVSFVSGVKLEDGHNGTFLMRDCTGDGKADLVFIKTKYAETNTVEVHVLSAESQYQTFVRQTGTSFTQEDNGVWTMSDKQDLVYIKTSQTDSKSVEVHIATYGSEYKSRTVDTASTFALEPANNGTWTIGPKSSPQYPDLYYIKTANADTNRVEVHVASAASNWITRTLEVPSDFIQENKGHWMVADWTHAAFADLVYVKTQQSDTNMVEVHIAAY